MMPQTILALPARHVIEIINNLIGRPYGWGKFGFNNDCSAELKSLYTPFGIYLLRYSSEQVKVSRICFISQGAGPQ